jgi:pimeloyl-ACP methyl ester carboxylesterase
MESHQLPYRNSYIHYLKFGRGTKYLFCFHGYGEDAFSFRFLEKSLAHDYILIAVDMPFHGQTVWKEDLAFNISDLQQIINKIVPLELQTISLLGYSMGGRISLALLQQIPSKIDRVVLIAPDGLHQNFWYWFSTQTTAGNKLFSYTMKNPHWFFGGMKLLRNLNLLNKSILKFAHSYLDDTNEREMLYKRWTIMRKLKPSASKLASALQKFQTPVRMLFGSYDRIITPGKAKKFTQYPSLTIKTIKAGHQLLKEKHAKDIAALFYD